MKPSSTWRGQRPRPPCLQGTQPAWRASSRRVLRRARSGQVRMARSIYRASSVLVKNELGHAGQSTWRPRCWPRPAPLGLLGPHLVLKTPPAKWRHSPIATAITTAPLSGLCPPAPSFPVRARPLQANTAPPSLTFTNPTTRLGAGTGVGMWQQTTFVRVYTRHTHTLTHVWLFDCNCNEYR